MKRGFSLLGAVVVVAAIVAFNWLAPQDASEAGPPGPTRAPTHFILAVSWEPAFCETAPSKPECTSQSRTRADANGFSLHGLWPDDEYCGVSDRLVAADRAGRWSNLPRVELSPPTRAALDVAMPGTQSLLERHEWIKHGTCAGVGPGVYFSRAIGFLGTLNGSPLQRLFARSVGRSVTLDNIRGALDASLGRGAGERLRVACDRVGDRRLVTELTIGLSGDVTGNADLATLVAAANPAGGGCTSGIVDPVGLQ